MIKYVILILMIAVLGICSGLLAMKHGHFAIGFVLVAGTFIASTSMIPLTYSSSYLSNFYIQLNKYEILDKIGLRSIKKYYVDKADTKEILDYIGYEKVKEHFKDKLQAEYGTNKLFQKSVSPQTLNLKSKLLNALTTNDEES